MQLRITRVKRGGTVHEYAQLVESYRRESDGMPMHRVVASLGALPALEIENLRAALKASREKKRVMLARLSKPASPSRPKCNLRYLDAATLLEQWNEWRLTAVFDELIPSGSSAVAAASVIAALTLQRVLDPGSKLYGARWFPTTALPELLGVKPAAFNNTRVHRVLDELDAAGTLLMAKLPRRYQEREGAFVSLFLDTTDTWFVGEGPQLAATGKTKEGLIRQKVGIVLLCNERGYPLRWETVSGSSADGPVMLKLLHEIAGLSWVGEAPVVFDRALGHTAQIAEVSQAGLRFVTALTTSEMGSYAQGLPHRALAELSPSVSDDPAQRASDARKAAAVAQAGGMAPVEDDLLVLDLGVVERELESDGGAPARAAHGSAKEAMRLAREAHEGLANGRYTSLAAAGRALGFSKALMSKYCQLLSLDEDLQRQILGGNAAGCSLTDLLRIARIQGADRQQEALAALIQTAPKTAAPRPMPPADRPAPQEPAPKSLKVRVAAYFNPTRFVEQRVHARRRLEDIAGFVAQLNSALASPRSKRTQQSAAAAVEGKLRSFDLVDAFCVKVSERETAGRKHWAAEATLDEQEWALRRRYDGFAVLVAEPSLQHSATELCRLYRGKDVVEKDFQTIKSVVELRPVRHHTDGKVRAHVTLCMLALLLERTLQHKLTGQHTAQAALATLEECRLNHYAPIEGGSAAYALNELTPEQKTILRLLRLERLGDEMEVVDRIAPR